MNGESVGVSLERWTVDGGNDRAQSICQTPRNRPGSQSKRYAVEQHWMVVEIRQDGLASAQEIASSDDAFRRDQKIRVDFSRMQ